MLADRGLTDSAELQKLGVKLIVPKFKGCDSSQFTMDECQYSEWIAKARVHIEHIIQQIRSFHIWDSTVKLSVKDVITQHFMACAYSNFYINFQLSICK